MANYINMNELTNEINEWGIEARLVFDEDGDGWIILAGFSKTDGKHEIMLHHGFEYNGEIYADIDKILVESNQLRMKEASLPWIIVNARTGWIAKNRQVKLERVEN